MNIETLSPIEFINNMVAVGLKKGYFITHNNTISASHPTLDQLVTFLKSSPNYHAHEGIFFQIEPEMNCAYFAFIHKTHRGAGQGGTRLFSYPTIANLLIDGLRLAEGMTYKNALAHLWWGGGKGIINDAKFANRSREERTKIMANYGKFVASLNGCYVTAEDMNTNMEDMRIIHTHCRHCTCTPVDIGGSGNPSPFSARGVQKAMEGAIHFLEGPTATLKGKHIAVQGAGNVGYCLVRNLVNAGAKVTVNDINPHTRQRLKKEFNLEQVTVLEPENVTIQTSANEILFTPCDILSPNAIGAILNDQTIPQIKARIIAGAANNQLQDPVKHSENLHKRGILFLPDYVINRLGIVNCANEMYGYVKEDIEKAVTQVYPDVMHLLEKAQEEDVTPFAYADIWAKEEADIPHPIWGHRGKKIIEQLVKNGWEER